MDPLNLCEARKCELIDAWVSNNSTRSSASSLAFRSFVVVEHDDALRAIAPDLPEGDVSIAKFVVEFAFSSSVEGGCSMPHCSTISSSFDP